jgi:beta-glucanase (GH16 family)
LWSTGWFNPTGISGPVGDSELECYDPAQVAVGGHELDLTAIAKNENCQTSSGLTTQPYASGIVTTLNHFQFTYGFIEARVWLPAAADGAIADWPAIWADGADGNWPTTGEIDILEGLGGGACYHFHYGSADNPESEGGCVGTGSDFTGGWHVFGADWEPGVITYYYDGIDVGDVTTDVTSDPMYLILDLAIDHTYGGAIVTPASTRIAYVRVWQRP